MIDDDDDDLCPICISNEPKYFTECGHSYCITCLCRITKCALCRKELVRSKICYEIKTHKKFGKENDEISIEIDYYNTLEMQPFNLRPLPRRRYMLGLGGFAFST